MLRIHKSHSKKLLTISITSICITSGLLGISALTYTPELSHAESVQYPSEIHPNISDITYMQDITRTVCTNTKVNQSAQLIDKRDNKTYWVARLKDGNCWMTQNLALDLDVNISLTKDSSDVGIDWTPSANTQYDIITEYPSNTNISFSYNPGEYFYTTPTEINNCGSTNINKISGCKNWQEAKGLSKDRSKDERAHYLAGNYYSFNVATVGSAPTTTSGSAYRSVCPKAWSLPSRDRIGKLLDGLTASGIITTNNALLMPYGFVYNGHVSTYPYGLQYAGAIGNLWSSTVTWLSNYGATLASYLDFSRNREYLGVFYSDNSNRALPVRCYIYGGIADHNIKLVIKPQLSLDVADEVTVEKSKINPSTAELNVKVASNQKYSVGISAANPNLTSGTNSTTIPAKSGLLNTAENGWGIKLKESTEFTALSTNLQTFYTATGAEIKTIPFTIGISTAPDIPNGKYSTNITITATQN